MVPMSTRPPQTGHHRADGQILREAARLFAERGFHGVGVDEIGAAVGISGPGLYRHFAGKDAMLAELLVGISERLYERRAAQVRGVGGGRARTRGGAGRADRGHIDFALDDRELITLHDRELDRLRDAERKRVRKLQRQYVELWVDAVRALYSDLSELEARVAVHTVFGLLNSTPHLSGPSSTARPRDDGGAAAPPGARRPLRGRSQSHPGRFRGRCGQLQRRPGRPGDRAGRLTGAALDS